LPVTDSRVMSGGRHKKVSLGWSIESAPSPASLFLLTEIHRAGNQT
jgi:hypothetical protein